MQFENVELLARLRPQPLHRIHARAIRLERDHLPVRAGDGRAGGERNAHADGAARELQPVMRRGTGSGGEEVAARRHRFVGDDGVFRDQRAEYLRNRGRIERTARGNLRSMRRGEIGGGIAGNLVSQTRQRISLILGDIGQKMDLAAFGRQSGGLAGISRRNRPDPSRRPGRYA